MTETNPANNTATDTDTLAPQADLRITKTDGVIEHRARRGGDLHDRGRPTPDRATSRAPPWPTRFPATLTSVTYTATATGGATGFTASGSGNITNTVTMPVGSTITYVVHGTLSTTATGTLADTATVTAPSGVTETNASNNTATDSDTIAAAPVINYPSGFTGATSSFAFNGSTAKIVGSNLQVTSTATSQATSTFYRTAVNIAAFNTQFSIQQLGGTNPSGDGMTFVIQNVGLTNVGFSGGNLGYGGMYNKSMAIKFDLYNNSGEGPSSTGLYIDGPSPTSAGSVNLTNAGIDLHSGHTMNVSMSYDGTTLTVTITDATTLVQATQSYTVNIPSIMGGNTAYVGFTGGTGGATATQNVLNWTYSLGSGQAGSSFRFTPLATGGATANTSAAPMGLINAAIVSNVSPATPSNAILITPSTAKATAARKSATGSNDSGEDS